MVALVDLVGLLPAQSVGEGVVELLFGEAHGLVAVGRVLEDREERADLGDRDHPDALRRHGVDGDAGGAVAVVEQDLGEQPAEWPMMIGGRSS